MAFSSILSRVFFDLHFFCLYFRILLTFTRFAPLFYEFFSHIHDFVLHFHEIYLNYYGFLRIFFFIFLEFSWIFFESSHFAFPFAFSRIFYESSQFVSILMTLRLMHAVPFCFAGFPECRSQSKILFFRSFCSLFSKMLINVMTIHCFFFFSEDNFLFPHTR